MTKSLTIGAFAKAVGVRPDTIRYYERNALLADPGRTEAGYRIYDENDLERVRFIRKAQRLGFTLKEIAVLLSLRSSDTARAADVLAITTRKIADLKTQIADLMRIEAALTALADDCPVDAPVADCPILAHLATASNTSDR
ncbi:heavy metal-responsive transcriptional regulator [Sphingobium sp.]|uniref:heavy metal-responsive transcriptional regulator n=1 Tax=Sphingobium sp. TaxID=1912891 RepID=UPI000DB06749|nr:heavy metal-responsive transcriptional regulator [Sphingobium sp.]PZU64004.1 MAG: heavy metal-responsive transcriptional regulator [Sphingobium sp.]